MISLTKSARAPWFTADEKDELIAAKAVVNMFVFGIQTRLKVRDESYPANPVEMAVGSVPDVRVPLVE